MNGVSPDIVLVAGSAGFLGSHLCDLLLAEGHRVIGLDSFCTGRPENMRTLARDPRFSFIEADIVDPLPTALTRHAGQIRRVFNLACPASPPHYQTNPEHTLLTCVTGTLHLLRLAERARARFLQASTSEIYGDPEVHPQREDYWGHVNPTGPRACYDEGKRAAETLCFDFARSGRVSVRVARIFNTYGPRMRADDGRVVSNMICQALSGEPMTVYGSGSQTRSFCYVADLVDGLARLMKLEDDDAGPVNLGCPGEMSMVGLAELVKALTGSASPVVLRPLPVDDPRRRCPDIGRATALLGWTPDTVLEAGLRETIDWFSAEIGAGAAHNRPADERAAAE